MPLNFRTRPNVWDDEILKGESFGEYYKIPDDAKVVIDVGAHIGGTALLCASKGALVYAYEPDPGNFEILKANVLQNQVKGYVEIFQKAVGFPTGKRTLGLSSVNYGGFGFFKENPDGTEEVDTITLQQVFDDNKIETCDVLKLDCEGAEYEILNNIDEKLFGRIKQISMEQHFATPEHQNKMLVERFGVNYAKDLVDKLSKYYKITETPSGAKSATFVICRK